MAFSSSLSRHPRIVTAIVLTSGAIGLYYVTRAERAQHHPTDQAQPLHRSNAISRRNARRPPLPADDTEVDVITRALDNLNLRNVVGTPGYGIYVTNNPSLPNMQQIFNSLPLVPRNLEQLYQEVCARLPDVEAEIEKFAIHTAFVDSWIRDEIPPDYQVWRQVEIHIVHYSLLQHRVLEPVIRQCIARHRGEEREDSVETRDALRVRSVQTDGPREGLEDETPARDGRETVADNNSSLSFDRAEDQQPVNTDPQMLGLLYKIAEQSARNEYFIHRGVQCCTCGVNPIQGIRYHCSNCPDFDICETCESTQIHARHHVFYKIRIPAPPHGRIKQMTPAWYPGDPSLFKHDTLPNFMAKVLTEEFSMDKDELDALFDQFRCLANKEWPGDDLGVAIDKTGFDKFFTAPTATSNLIYERLFAFYDKNLDGLIDFHEFLEGVTALQDKSRDAKLRRIFTGYDVDGDGFVGRKDFLRMLRAYYVLFKELSRELITNQDEDTGAENPRPLIESSAPISTFFSHRDMSSHVSRAGQGKSSDINGDMVLEDGNGALQEDLPAYGDRHEAIGNAATRLRRHQPFRTFRTEPVEDEPLISLHTFPSYPMLHPDDADDWEIEGADPTLHMYGWPPLNDIHPEDIVNALGRNIAVDDIMDPVDRSRVIYAQAQRLDQESDQQLQTSKKTAVEERWRRKQFYTDFEEGMIAPPGYKENDSSDDEGEKVRVKPANSRRLSMRSRSSSKVRFEDNVTDTDYETRSNASSRAVSVSERWGGFEISEAEKDVGKEIVFQAVEQGFNELLNPIFFEAESQAIKALDTAANRQKWQAKLRDYEQKITAEKKRNEDALRAADLLRTEELLGGSDGVANLIPPTRPTMRLGPTRVFLRKAHELILAEQSERCRELLELVTLYRGSPATREEVLNKMRGFFLEKPDLLENLPEFTEEEYLAALKFDFDAEDAEIKRQGEKIADQDTEIGDEQLSPAGEQEHVKHNIQASSEASQLAIIKDEHTVATESQDSPTAATEELREADPEEEEPSEETLALWLKHQRIDAEAKKRGGYGKLSYFEFEAKMVDEDEVGAALGLLDDGGDAEKKWSKSAGLGRLEFVGSWLEQGCF